MPNQAQQQYILYLQQVYKFYWQMVWLQYLQNTKQNQQYYKNLNRLTDTRRYNSFGVNCTSKPAGTTETTSINYNNKGNITNKDGQTYSYLTASENSIGASPHQLQTKGNQVFDYDLNGNNTRMEKRGQATFLII